jgi:hypothetical protein
VIPFTKSDEKHIKAYYDKDGQIDTQKALGEPLRILINVKDLEQTLDLKKEVILTMLSQLEKEDGGEFIKLE